MDAELIEKVARVMHATQQSNQSPDWDGLGVAGRFRYREMARAAIAALSATPQADDAKLSNPYTGDPRDYRDVESDPTGVLIREPGAPLRAATPQAAQVPNGTPMMSPGVFHTGLWKTLPGKARRHASMLTQSWATADSSELKWALEAGVMAIWQAAQPQAAQVPEGLTPRHWRLIDFALWRLIRAAYDRAEAAAQDKAGRFYSPSALEAFMRDATDAEAARGIVSAAIKANGWDAAAQAQGVGRG